MFKYTKCHENLLKLNLINITSVNVKRIKIVKWNDWQNTFRT
jgi:hypothetical protein